MAGSNQSRKGSPKAYRMGGKQKHGSSRHSYFVTRNLWRAAANKARRIAKDRKAKEAAKN